MNPSTVLETDRRWDRRRSLTPLPQQSTPECEPDHEVHQRRKSFGDCELPMPAIGTHKDRAASAYLSASTNDVIAFEDNSLTAPNEPFAPEQKKRSNPSVHRRRRQSSSISETLQRAHTRISKMTRSSVSHVSTSRWDCDTDADNEDKVSADMHMHWLTLQFPNSDVEKVFGHYYFGLVLARVRWATICTQLICLLNVVVIGLTETAIPDASPFLFGLLYGVPSSVTAVLSFRPDLFEPLWQFMVVLVSLTLYSSVTASVYLRDEMFEGRSMMLLVCFVAGPYFIFNIQMRWATLTTVAMITAYLAAAGAGGKYTDTVRFANVSVLLCCIGATFVGAARNSEAILRRRFLVEIVLEQDKERLERKVERFQKGNTRKIEAMAPVASAIDSLTRVLNEGCLEKTEKEVILEVIKQLSKDNVYKPDIAGQLAEGKHIEDADTQKWLLTYAQGKDEELVNRLSADRKSSVPNVAAHTARIELKAIPEDAWDGVHAWNFDCFAFERVTEGKPLIYLATYLFDHYGLFTRFSIPRATFARFVRAVASSYLHLPFHNQTHAVDVMQTLHYFILVARERTEIQSIEVLALLVAAFVHDVGHNGRSNAFHVATGSDLAMRYNDKHVLENYHLFETFELLKRDELNIFASLTPSNYRYVRKLIIEVVLATDLSSHFELVGKFTTRVKGDFSPSTNENDRLLFFQIMMKAADTSNSAKPPPLNTTWTGKIMEEFFVQGDKEKEVKLPISPFMNRDDSSIPSCQIGFIDFLVEPLYRLWTEYVTDDDVYQQLMRNRADWEDQKAADQEARPLSGRSEQTEDALLGNGSQLEDSL